MFWVGVKRVIQSGFVSFWRNKVVSLASVLVVTVTLFVIGSLLLTSVMLNSSLDALKDKVDINVYFKLNASETDIFALRDALKKLPEVKAVDYVSREKALEDFRAKHQDNSLIISSLEELGDNPLGASLSVRAFNPSDYESIASFLQSGNSLPPGASLSIDKVNFIQNKTVIDRMTKIIAGVERLGLAVSIVFIVIAVLVSFNTIRLAIFTAREEIAVMRLVGADNWYIRGPFIIEGIMYGIVGAFITMILFYPVTAWVGGVAGTFFGGVNLATFYMGNLVQMLLILLATGAVLGIVSSVLAVHRYLKV
jgi:cell division transport system permease protein